MVRSCWTNNLTLWILLDSVWWPRQLTQPVLRTSTNASFSLFHKRHLAMLNKHLWCHWDWTFLPMRKWLPNPSTAVTQLPTTNRLPLPFMTMVATDTWLPSITSKQPMQIKTCLLTNGKRTYSLVKTKWMPLWCKLPMSTMKKFTLTSTVKQRPTVPWKTNWPLPRLSCFHWTNWLQRKLLWLQK